jgi:hypothetical protein
MEWHTESNSPATNQLTVSHPSTRMEWHTESNSLGNIHAKVHALMDEVCGKWVAEIPFEVTDLYGLCHDGSNILAYFSDMYKGQKFNFDVVRYPKNNDGEKALVKDLRNTAVESGFAMIVKEI